MTNDGHSHNTDKRTDREYMKNEWQTIISKIHTYEIFVIIMDRLAYVTLSCVFYIRQTKSQSKMQFSHKVFYKSKSVSHNSCVRAYFYDDKWGYEGNLYLIERTEDDEKYAEHPP